MKIIVTGGSGYVGTWLIKELIEMGHQVRIVDVNEPNPILKNKVEYIKTDITNKSQVLKGLKDADIVYHLAAVVSKLRGLEDRETCIKTNVNGTLYVLEACRKYDVKKLIYMGTSEVLGEPLFVPTDERHHRAPKTTYGITKCAGEDLCYEYFHAYGLNTLMPRLYMIYGIDDTRAIKYHNVIVKFVYNTLNNEPPVAFKDCIRTFLYITDCSKALSLFVNKGKSGEVYDICDRPEYAISMEDLAYKIIDLCGKDIKPIIKDAPPTDTKVKIPSGYKSYAELGWSPEIKLEVGLKKVINWIKSNNPKL